MLFSVLLDIVLFTLIAWIAITQLLIPALRGSRVFPVFSKPSHKIADELAEVEQEIEAEHLRHELDLKRQLLRKEQQHEQST